MKVVPVSVNYANPLVNKYLTNSEEVRPLFEHSPADPDSFADRYNRVMRDYHTDRTALVRILSEYNSKLGCGEKTRENLQAMLDPGTAAVVTGQQAGIMTGPLYTIYKTITAVQLARELTGRIGKKVVPVFWVAAEDHDYAEIDHIDLINRKQELVRLKLDYTPPGKLPAGRIPVTEAVNVLIDQLEENTNPSEWKEEIIGMLKTLAGQHGNVADWFAAIMTWLFRSHGLIMVNPLLGELRGLLSGTLEVFLDRADDIDARLQSGIDRVKGLGAEPQVLTMKGQVNLFLYTDGERLPLVKEGGCYSVRGRELSWTHDELIHIARSQPELLSPNVVLRPIAQDMLLPILAYAAGPGEIAYYALYRDIYPLFNQAMPVIYPRVSITLVERGLARYMENYGVDFADGEEGLDRRLEEHLTSRDEIGIDRLFAGSAEEVKSVFRNLTAMIAQIDSELNKHGNESLNKALHQLDYLEKKTRQHHRRSCDLIIKRFNNMRHQLFPRHTYQERVFNVFPYLFKYGPGLTDNLLQIPLLGGFGHKLVYLG